MITSISQRLWNSPCIKYDESEDLWLQTTLRLDGSKAEMIIRLIWIQTVKKEDLQSKWMMIVSSEVVLRNLNCMQVMKNTLVKKM